MPSTDRSMETKIAVALVIAAAISRVVPHPWNFTPLTAIALFCGVRFRSPVAAIVTPLLALTVGDLALGLFPYEGMMWVYLATALIVTLGLLARPKSVVTSSLFGLGGGLLFFAVTNFGVWATGHLYPNTTAGLAACYAAAIPFYRSQIVADVLFTLALFGSHALAVRAVSARRPPLAS
jgi:hypothetical protein